MEVSASVLGVPEVEGDELDSVPPLQPSGDRSLVEVETRGEGEARLINLEHPGNDLLVSRLGDERVQLVDQDHPGRGLQELRSGSMASTTSWL